MDVKLLAHTQLSKEFLRLLEFDVPSKTDGQAVALTNLSAHVTQQINLVKL